MTEDKPTLTVVGNEEPTFIDQLPSGISWPDSLETVMSAEEAKELYTQIANKAITDWVGTDTYILIQFQDPQSIHFGVRVSEEKKKPTNEALAAVLRKLLSELDTVNAIELAMSTPFGQAIMSIAGKVAADNQPEGTVVDANGLPVLNLNRDQKRHPEKYGYKVKE